MKNYAYGIGIFLISGGVAATPMNGYRGVDRLPAPAFNHHPHPVFNHQAPRQTQYYSNSPAQRYHPARTNRSSYPYGVYVTQPQVAIVMPHVGIYVEPQQQYHYQHTEEVYLPEGGTYRSTVEYVPQYAPYPVYPQRRVLGQGQFYLE